MKKIFFLLILLVSNTLYADLYVCTIVNVFGLNDNGYFVTHGWKGNYVKRKFTIDNVSGNILSISCEDSSSTASVSWLVIGERKDKHMIDTEWTDSQGKVIVEPLKTEGWEE